MFFTLKNKPYQLSILVFAGLLFLFNACKKDTFSDLDRIQDAADYSQSSVGRANGILIQNVSYGDTTTDVPGAPVFLSAVSGQNTNVSASIDTALVKSYNEMYGTSYPMIRQGAFGLVDSIINIPAGVSQSRDSVRIKLKKGSFLSVGLYPYLIPVRLVSKSGGSLKSTILFLKMNVQMSQVFARISDGGAWYDGGVYGYTLSRAGNMMLDYSINKMYDNPIKGPDSLNFSVMLTESIAATNLLMMAGLDNSDSVIQYFNKVNGTNVKPFPSNTFEMQSAQVSMGSRSYVYNGLSMKFKNYDAFNVNDTFLVALKVLRTNIPFCVEPDTASMYQNVFLRLKVNHIYPGNVDATNSGLTGTLVNRSNWSVTSSYGSDAAYNSSRPSETIDGNNDTYWYSPGWSLPQSLILDMGTPQSIKGFRLTPQYVYIDADFLWVGVSTSQDGKSWTSQGFYFGTPTDASTSSASPDINTIKFVNPVNARYFQFAVFKSTAAYNSAIAEINAIQ